MKDVLNHDTHSEGDANTLADANSWQPSAESAPQADTKAHKEDRRGCSPGFRYGPYGRLRPVRSSR